MSHHHRGWAIAIISLALVVVALWWLARKRKSSQQQDSLLNGDGRGSRGERKPDEDEHSTAHRRSFLDPPETPLVQADECANPWPVSVFVVSTFLIEAISWVGLSILGAGADGSSTPVTVLQLFWISSPIMGMLAAVVYGLRVCNGYSVGFKGSLRLRELRLVALACFLPAFSASTQALVAGASGKVGWRNTDFLHRVCNAWGGSVAEHTGMCSWDKGLVVWFSFFWMCTGGLFWDLTPPPSDDWGQGSGISGCSWVVEALMEEIGWSFVLFPELMKLTKGDFVKSAVISGAIWPLWHFPYIILGDTGLSAIPSSTGYEPGTEDTPFVYGLCMFFVSLFFFRVIMCWAVHQTHTIWAPVCMHAIHNGLVISLFGQLDKDRGNLAAYVVGESGFILTILYGFCGSCLLFTALKHQTLAVRAPEEQFVLAQP